MTILGISAFYHDSAAALIVNGEIIAAVQEERFTRIKHDSAFPSKAIRYCLDEIGLSESQVDAIVFYDKPLLKFERLLDTYLAFAPKGLSSFIKAIPVWLDEKLFFKRLIRKELKQIGFADIPKMLFSEHHLSHAASAYYPSKFNDAAILTIDGVGEWATATISKGEGEEIRVLKELHFPHSLGLLYSSFTYFLGFRVNSGEYKLMGLAPYGNPNGPEVKEFEKIIKKELVDIKNDGSILLNQKYFKYATGLKMINDKKWEKLFGIKKRVATEEINQRHCNLALAIQIITEEIVHLMAMEAKKITKSDNLCLAGGVALNCVSNGKLQSSGLFKNIYAQPASGDAGGAIGAALAANYIYYSQQRKIDTGYDMMKGAFIGPSITEKDIIRTINKYRAEAKKYEYSDVYKEISKQLDQGQIIGWVQGRMEFGPRALGGRSILGDARNPEMQKRLNMKIKFRETFRPFAPAVLSEDAHDYFKMSNESPYMLFVSEINEDLKNKLPSDYQDMSLKEKLYFNRSRFPAISHIDFSSRVQTVHKETNPHFWNLLSNFKHLTGAALIVNTSFNVRGEPIVCTAEDAYRCFMRTDMDTLVIGNYIFNKVEQPKWKEKRDWQEDFVPD